MATKKIKVLSRQLKCGVRHTGYYLAPDGSYRGVGTWDSKAVARQKAQEGFAAARQNDWIDPRGSRTVLDHYATQVWFPSLLVEVKTRLAYESTYRCHIKPTFGARELGSVLYTEVQAWLNGLETAGIGRATQRAAFVILNMIFKAAQRDRLINSRPTEGIRARPVPHPEVKIFHREEWDRVYDKLPAHWKPLMLVAVETGMRLSELRALTPSQVDWTRQRIHVDRATVIGSKRSGYGRFVQKAYPKGRRSRAITVDRAVLTVIATTILAQGLPQDSDEVLFVNEAGRPISEEVNAVLARACEAANVPIRTFKHLRSTKASWMLQDTRDLMAVKEQLGHADITTTQKYLAVVTDADDSPALTFSDYLSAIPAE